MGWVHNWKKKQHLEVCEYFYGLKIPKKCDLHLQTTYLGAWFMLYWGIWVLTWTCSGHGLGIYSTIWTCSGPKMGFWSLVFRVKLKYWHCKQISWSATLLKASKKRFRNPRRPGAWEFQKGCDNLKMRTGHFQLAWVGRASTQPFRPVPGPTWVFEVWKLKGLTYWYCKQIFWSAALLKASKKHFRNPRRPGAWEF